MANKLYLRKVHFKGFKSIEDLSTHFAEGFNIVIGKNGAGKSNFLEFIFNALLSTYRSRVTPTFKYAKMEFLSEDNQVLAVEMERALSKQTPIFDEEEERVSFKYKLYFDNKLVNEADFNGVRPNGIQIFRQNIRYSISKLGYRVPYPLYLKFGIPTDQLDCISIPGRMTIPLNETDIWDLPDCLGFIDSLFMNLENSFTDDSENLINLDKSILLSRMVIDFRIVENLKRFSPIENIRFNENLNIYFDDSNAYVENLKIDFLVNDNWLPWSQLSDGTKRLFYIISEITFRDGGPILIEEPELGVHPHQFGRIMNFLKEEAESKQIILSTHSPQALNHLAKDELDQLLIASYDYQSGTTISHLTDEQRSKAKHYMQDVGFLSDYWMLSDLEQ